MRRALVSGMTLLLVLLMSGARSATADPIHDLMAQLLKSEPLIPDGSASADDPLPFGNTTHVVTHDNQDSWKIQVSSGAVTFENDQCDPAETPIPPGALHLVVSRGVGPLTYARLRAT